MQADGVDAVPGEAGGGEVGDGFRSGAVAAVGEVRAPELDRRAVLELELSPTMRTPPCLPAGFSSQSSMPMTSGLPGVSR